MKSLLITGSTGFVGTNLRAYINEHLPNWRVFLLVRGENRQVIEKKSDTRDQTENESDLASFGSSLIFWEELEHGLPDEIETIIHLAGKAHDTKNASKPEEYFEVNTVLTERLFDAYLKSNATKFIFLSSVKAVADSVQGILTEDAVPNPQTPYGQSKLAAELIIQKQLSNFLGLQEEETGLQFNEDWRKSENDTNSEQDADKSVYLKTKDLKLKTVFILRPCMIHGPGNKGNLNLLYQLVSKNIPWPLAAFENQRSFLSVDNLCFVIKEFITNEHQGGIYQVADDEAVSTNELITMIAESLGKKAQLLRLPPLFIRMLVRIGDPLKLPMNSERLQKLTESYVVSNRKLIATLGINLPLEAKQGMRRTFEHFSK